MGEKSKFESLLANAKLLEEACFMDLRPNNKVLNDYFGRQNLGLKFENGDHITEYTNETIISGVYQFVIRNGMVNTKILAQSCADGTLDSLMDDLYKKSGETLYYKEYKRRNLTLKTPEGFVPPVRNEEKKEASCDIPEEISDLLFLMNLLSGRYIRVHEIHREDLAEVNSDSDLPDLEEVESDMEEVD